MKFKKRTRWLWVSFVAIVLLSLSAGLQNSQAREAGNEEPITGSSVLVFNLVAAALLIWVICRHIANRKRSERE
jgi:hypothetical protein